MKCPRRNSCTVRGPESKVRLFFPFALIFAFVWGSAAEGAGRLVTVNHVFDAPQLEEVNGYTRVTVRECGAFHQVGAPALPFRTARILLPPQSKVNQIACEVPDNLQTFATEKPVEFGRTPVPVGIPSHPAVARAAQDKPTPTIYAMDNPYPESRVQLMSVQQMNGYSIAIVRIFPVQYRPRTGQLLFYPSLRVIVTLSSQAPLAATAGMIRAKPSDAARIASFVDNQEIVGEYAAVMPTRLQPLTTHDYLLITSTALTNAFAPLVSQKTADGLSVKVETVESILAGYSGLDDAEKLRNYIKYAYANWGIEYVLLGGDVSTVPYRGAYAYCQGTDTNMPCDLYFSCLDGSWNSNSNALWGEPNDGDGGGDVDLLGEVYVGRAPVETEAEVANFLSKTLRYEQIGHANWNRARFLGEYLGNYDGVYAQGGDGLDPLLPNFSYYTVDWLDDRPANAETWGNSECVAALNLSPHIVAHDGHASETYALRLNISDVDSLTNSEPFLINSVGCYCGAFDYSDCIAEEFVKRNQYGAFAVLMNSRYGWFDENEEWKFSGEFMERFFHELLSQGNRNIGKANQLSKQDMIGSVETSGDMVYRWCYFEINLLGDPHTPFVPLDSLIIAPSEELAASGYEGGPFSPTGQTYVVRNDGSNTVGWVGNVSAPWLTLSPSSGSVPAGQSNDVAACLTASANALTAGTYSATIQFSNTASGVAQTRTASLSVYRPRISFFALDSDPGWSRQGEWAFGKPNGRGGAANGHPDPAGGATGTNVFGVNLNGDYSTKVAGPCYVTAGPFNFGGCTGTQLRFRRWLNTDFQPYVYATVDVSTNGASWTQIWSNSGGSEIADAAWQTLAYDISGLADNRTNVSVRWGYQIASDAYPYSGWNIDDIEFTGYATRTSHGTLVWWLQQYGLTNFPPEVEDLRDVDRDGLCAWQEYVAGTDPTNQASVLRVLSVVSDGATDTVRWLSSGLAPGYNLFYSTNLGNSGGWLRYSNNIAPMPATNALGVPWPGRPAFYKVTVTN